MIAFRCLLSGAAIVWAGEVPQLTSSLDSTFASLLDEQEMVTYGSPPRQLGGEAKSTEAIAGACAGQTVWKNTEWVQHRANKSVIYVDIDTSRCGFELAPIYVSSLGGEYRHWTTTGASEVHAPTAKGFRVYIMRSEGITPAKANSNGWRVNWIGLGVGTNVYATGVCSGKTVKGSTNWVEGKNDRIVVDIDTTECGFNGTKSRAPLIFTNVIGQLGVDVKPCVAPKCTQLTREEVRKPGAKGFSVSLFHPGVTPAYANKQGLYVNWIGMDIKTKSKKLTTPCSGRTRSPTWVAYKDGVYTDVNTSKCGFSRTPCYISSLQGENFFWKTTGSTELYKESPTGFRVYIHMVGITPSQAKKWKWRIAWMAAKSITKTKDDPFPTLAPTPAPTPSPKPLTHAGWFGCSGKKQCDACKGDCDKDGHCKGTLKCFQRFRRELVPGCAEGGSGDVVKVDYCYDPALAVGKKYIFKKAGIRPYKKKKSTYKKKKSSGKSKGKKSTGDSKGKASPKGRSGKKSSGDRKGKK